MHQSMASLNRPLSIEPISSYESSSLLPIDPDILISACNSFNTNKDSFIPHLMVVENGIGHAEIITPETLKRFPLLLRYFNNSSMVLSDPTPLNSLVKKEEKFLSQRILKAEEKKPVVSHFLSKIINPSTMNIPCFTKGRFIITYSKKVELKA
jgi:hypothetical protein